MMRLTSRVSLALLLILALASGIQAQAKKAKAVPLEIKGDTITVVRSFPFTVTAGAGADLYFWSYPAGVEATSADGVLTVTKAPQGKVTVKVTSITIIIDFDAKTKRIIKDEGAIEVTVGAVPPGPEPAPVPPPTPDALVKELKDAYAAEKDTKKQTHLSALAALYRQAAKLDLAGVKTAGELALKLKAASLSLLPADALPEVRKVVGTELRKVLPAATDAELTAEQKQRATALFGRLGEALTEAGK